MDFILRPWKESDAKTLARHLNNKKIWDNCRDGLPFPYTETDADTFIKYASEQVEQNEYCIEANHEAIGNIGFVRGTDVERFNAEVGYWISETYWNKGLTKDNRFVLNELNTLPGFTEISMYPKLWEASGTSYKDLITELIALSVVRDNRNSELLTESK